MVRIYYASGTVREYDYDWQKLAPKLSLGGLRMFMPQKNTLIPLNSNTIELIERLDEEVMRPVEKEELVQEGTPFEPPIEAPVEPVVAEAPKEEKQKSAQERADERLALMKELSECPHEVHRMYYSDSLVGKASKPVRRYFPVCEKCGVREKFVKAESLSDEIKETATLWTKS